MKRYRNAHEALATVLEVALYMGWEVSIPHLDGEDIVPGLVMGTREYLDTLLAERNDHVSFQRQKVH